MYVKTERKRKKGNDLDEIDREFRRKLIEMRNRRGSNRYRQDKKIGSMDLTESTLVPYEGTSEDTIRDIQSVFEQHNKEAVEKRRGRVIQVPRLKLLL